MAFWDFLKRQPQQGRLEETINKGSSGGYASVYELVNGDYSSGGVSNQRLLETYRRTPRIHSIVKMISNDVASVDWKLYRLRGKRPNAQRRAITNKGWKQQAELIIRQVASQELEEVEDHLLLDFLDRGNFADMCGYDVQFAQQGILETTGTVFIVLYWVDEAGNIRHDFTTNKQQPLGMLPFTTNEIEQRPSEKEPFYIFKWGAKRQKVDKEAVFVIKEIDLANLYGDGVGTAATLADEIDSDESAALMIKGRFNNGGKPDGFVKIEGAEEEEIQRAKVLWEQRHRGSKKFGRMHFTNTDIDFKSISHSFDELQLLQLRAFARDTFGHTWGIPPEKSGILENSNKATIEKAEQMYQESIILPRKEKIARTYQKRIVPFFADDLVLGFETIVPADKDREQEIIQAHPHAFTLNQLNKRGGYSGFGEEGDVLIVPSGMVVVDPRDIQEGPLVTPPESEAVKGAEEVQKEVVTKDELTQRQVKELMLQINKEQIWDEVKAPLENDLEKWGQGVLDQMNTGIKFDMQNPRVLEHISTFAGDRIEDLVNVTTRDALGATLSEGIANGETLKELRGRIEKTFTEGNLAVDKVRSARIARTEVLRSSNFGNLEAFKQSGVISKKQWWAAFVNSRDEHIALHGQVQPTDKPFEIDGSQAQHPGGFGVAALDINCGCQVLAVVSDPDFGKKSKAVFVEEDADIEDEDKATEIAEVYEEETISWREDFQKAYTKGLKKQMQAVLDKFDSMFNL